MQRSREANSEWHGIVMFAYAAQGSKRERLRDMDLLIRGHGSVLIDVKPQCQENWKGHVPLLL